MHRIGLYLCIAVAICAVSRCDASPYMSRQEAAEDQKCKDLCGICNCIGFYCGDECICECNKRDDDDDDDDNMHANCAKNKAPFEVLIQGPAGSRFVRSLMPMDSLEESSDPKKRSTISIFHPDENKEIFGFAENEADRKLMKRETETDAPAKVINEKDDSEHTTAAPEQPKDAESSSTTEASTDKPQEDQKVKRDLEADVPAKEATKPTDEATTPAAPATSEASPSTTEKASEKTDDERKVKRDAPEVPSENIGEIEAKAEAGESASSDASTTEPTVGVGLPILSPILALKTLPFQAKAINLAVLKNNLKLKADALMARKFVDVGTIPAKIAALKARVGILAPPLLAPPLLPPPILPPAIVPIF